MLKKTIAYNNLDGEAVIEDFYFNLTKAELMKMELSEDEGFKEHLEKIVKSGKGRDIIAAFETILRAAYGERSPDGRFIKSPAAFDAFTATEAYSDLFFELVTDAKKSAEFINAIIPTGMVAEVEKAQTAQGVSPNLVVMDEAQNLVDLQNLSHAELIEAYRKKLAE